MVEGIATVARRRHWVEVRTADGVDLAVRHVAPFGEPVGACIVGHGLMLNGTSVDLRRRPGLATAIADAGFHVYVVDLRGHGRSQVSPTTECSFDALVRLDVPAVVAAARSRHPGMPVAGAGHSLMGVALLAHAAVTPAGGDRVDAVVTLASNVWLRTLETSMRRRFAKRALTEMFAAVTLAAGRFPARRLRLGTDDVPAALVWDLVRWSRSGHWTSHRGFDYLPALRNLRMPILAVLAERDRLLCHPDAARRFYAQLADADLLLDVVGEERATPAPGHMDLVLNAACAPVWGEIAAWLRDVLAEGGAR